MNYKKYCYPAVAKIPGINFDINLLNQEVSQLNLHWSNIFQANRGLCANHHDLANNNYHHFKQINLTYFEPTSDEFLELEELKKECKILSNNKILGNTKVSRYRNKINKFKNIPAALIEHNWYHPLPIYQNSYIKHAIESQFKSKAIRVRLSRIEAGKYLTPHIDYDTTYAIRIIVPISGTKDVINVVWPKNERQEFNLKADGSAYFLNVGYKHSVENRGTEDRIALMFSLSSQEDIYPILLEKQNERTRT